MGVIVIPRRRHARRLAILLASEVMEVLWMFRICAICYLRLRTQHSHLLVQVLDLVKQFSWHDLLQVELGLFERKLLVVERHVLCPCFDSRIIGLVIFVFIIIFCFYGGYSLAHTDLLHSLSKPLESWFDFTFLLFSCLFWYHRFHLGFCCHLWLMNIQLLWVTVYFEVGL